MASFENVWQTCKLVQQFDELFSQMKYKEAAHLVPAHQGLLRTPYIVAKFQNVPVQPNQPAAVLQYFGTILIYDNLTPFQMDAFEPFLPSQIFANQNMDVDNNLPSNSVDIVSYGEAFEPYQSHFARELSDEFRRIEKDRKRSWDLLNWKWEEVIDLDKDESNLNGDEEGGEEGDKELVDTTDSAVTRPVKIPRVIVRYRGSVHHVGDAAADEPNV